MAVILRSSMILPRVAEMPCSIDFLPTLWHAGRHAHRRGRAGLRRRRARSSSASLCEALGVPTAPTTASRCFDFAVCAPRAGPGARPPSGFDLHRRARPGPAPPTPTWSRSPAMRARSSPSPDEVLERAARRPHARGARILSVCTGAFVLGEAGPARRPRVHHALAAHRRARRALPAGPGRARGALRRRRPGRHQRRLGGRPRRRAAPVAPGVRRRARPAPSPAGWSCRRSATAGRRSSSPAPCPTATPRPSDRCSTWITEHLGEDLDVEALARRSHMSPRTFARRFRAETGTTPHALGHQPAGAGRRGAARAHRPLGRLDRRRGRLRQRRDAAPPLHPGRGGSARSSTAAASPADRRSGPSAARQPSWRRAVRSAAWNTWTWRTPSFHIESHIVVASAGESVPARSASMSWTCISHVATAVRAAGAPSRPRATCSAHARSGRRRVVREAAPRTTDVLLRRRLLGSVEVRDQVLGTHPGLVPEGRRLLQADRADDQLVHRADVHLPLVHRGSGRAHGHGQRLGHDHAALHPGQAGSGVRRRRPLVEAAEPAGAGTGGRWIVRHGGECRARPRPAGHTRPARPSAKACASRRSTTPSARSDAGSASAGGSCPTSCPMVRPPCGRARRRPATHCAPDGPAGSARNRGKCRTGRPQSGRSVRSCAAVVRCRVRRRRGAGVTRAVDCAMMRA